MMILHPTGGTSQVNAPPFYSGKTARRNPTCISRTKEMLRMKTLISASCITALLALIFVITVSLIGAPHADAEHIPDTDSENFTDTAPLKTYLPDKDADISVSLLTDGTVQTMSLYDYLVGVLSAEMPGSFETEALRAQAVAARTYTLHKMLVAPSQNHPEADVCDDITCCKAYASYNDMLEKWGDDVNTYKSKMEHAVSSTDGLCLSYDDEPVLAVFHSSSGGMTEASENVWGGTVPYLKAVHSPETESDVPNLTVSVTVSVEDFKNTVLASFPGASFSGAKLVSDDAVYSESGRLMSVTVCGVSVTGTQLRSMFGLRSAAIDLEETDDAVILTTKGYGHGVGMSQYGANVLAQDGWDFSEILLHYYTGAEIVSSDSFSLS